MKKHAKLQGGQAIIEFALVLPFLCLILLGIIEFGIIFYNKAMVTNASREGARAGIKLVKYSDGSCGFVGMTTVEEAATKYLEEKLISFGAIPAYDFTGSQVVGGSPDCGGNGYVDVRVSYQHTFLVIPNFLGFNDNKVDLQAQTIMRLQ